jgi:hypothetical protein
MAKEPKHSAGDAGDNDSDFDLSGFADDSALPSAPAAGESSAATPAAQPPRGNNIGAKPLRP